MTLLHLLATASLLWGCATPREEAQAPIVAPDPVAVDGVTPAPLSPSSPTPGTLPPPGSQDPASGAGSPTLPPVVPAATLYAQCRDRVEGVGAPGECTTDADCARAGCSQEVCVTRAAAAEVMTTCEVLPCFRVLDACGCHDGTCSWTIKETALVPAPLTLPPR